LLVAPMSPRPEARATYDDAAWRRQGTQRDLIDSEMNAPPPRQKARPPQHETRASTLVLPRFFVCGIARGGVWAYSYREVSHIFKSI